MGHSHKFSKKPKKKNKNYWLNFYKFMAKIINKKNKKKNKTNWVYIYVFKNNN